MAVAITRRRFTIDDYHRMGEAGILCEDDRVELIDGEILAMSPIGPPHCAGVDRATRAMVMAAGERAIVRVQGSVQLDRFCEPQPDMVLLRPRDDFYASRHPGPRDILLVVEVADSSIDYDRDVKAPMYAALGVPEYWLADLTQDVLTVHADPGGGTYRHRSVHRRGETIAPGLLPEAAVPVDVFLPDRG
jgi:Uma2 family endonuclease